MDWRHGQQPKRSARGHKPMRWLTLRINAPLASFGGPIIDAYGTIDDAPAQSMITGLLANAMGWDRKDHAKQSDLQRRLVTATLWPNADASNKLVDYQTAQIGFDDEMWTTRPHPRDVENRKASAKETFAGSHQRWRHYHQDLQVFVAMTLDPPDTAPTLDDLAAALQHPARVLFIGRKPCLPSAPIYDGELEADSPRAALVSMGCGGRGFWPAGASENGANVSRVFDIRDHAVGLHSGSRLRATGIITPAEAG